MIKKIDEKVRENSRLLPLYRSLDEILYALKTSHAMKKRRVFLPKSAVGASFWGRHHERLSNTNSSR